MWTDLAKPPWASGALRSRTRRCAVTGAARSCSVWERVDPGVLRQRLSRPRVTKGSTPVCLCLPHPQVSYSVSCVHH